MSKIYYIKVDKLRLLNNNIKFESVLQKQLYDSLVKKYFFLEQNSADKLLTLLPKGVTIEDIVIDNMDTDSFIDAYVKKSDILSNLESEIKDILNEGL
jgi:hypothetical protein